MTPGLAALLVARFARSSGACVVREPTSEPAPFIPARGTDRPTIPGGWTSQRFLPAGRASGSCRLDGPGIPATPESHTPPQPIPSSAPVGAHSVIPRTSWLAAACEPSLRSGWAGGREPARADRTAVWVCHLARQIEETGISGRPDRLGKAPHVRCLWQSAGVTFGLIPDKYKYAGGCRWRRSSSRSVRPTAR